MSTDFAGAQEALMQFLYRAPIGLLQTTLDGQVEIINPMAANLLMPLSRDGGLDNLFVALATAAPQLPALVAAFGADTGVVCDALRFAVPGGDRHDDAPKCLAISLMKVDSGMLMAMLADVTMDLQRERLDLTRRLDAEARIDSLTRLPNRAVALERLDRLLEQPPDGADCGFAVLFINCDRLRHINDAHGHAAGDAVLGQISDRLRASVRPTDRRGRGPAGGDIAARVGGDEFAVILDDLRHPDDAQAIAERLLAVLARAYEVGTHRLHCGTSMGIVLGRDAIGHAADVLQDASIAMVEAKRAGGGGCVVFEPAMRDRAARRAGVEEELHHAITDGQLFVVYQPVVGLQDALNRSAGVEALVRWRHPIRGIVPPLEFISVAESCGLIGPIGEFVLRTACNQFVAWRMTLGVRAPKLLAVNLSRAQLALAGFVDTVHDIIRSSGIPPGALQLEVTESLAAQDEAVQMRLHELKALGLTLALDDFGTGYSSLASLHQLPVDTVKIDRSFVARADTSPHHRVLIEATVRVASSLGMSTVAEGIETADQAAVVRQLGCDKGQGYLYSRPLAAGDVAGWLLDTAPVAEACCPQPG